MPYRVLDRFAEAEKQLLSFLASRMIHIADIASLFTREVSKQRLADYARRRWSAKAVVERKLMTEQEPMYSNSRGSGFHVASWEERDTDEIMMSAAEPSKLGQSPSFGRTPWVERARDNLLDIDHDTPPGIQDQRASNISSVIHLRTTTSSSKGCSRCFSPKWDEPCINQSFGFPESIGYNPSETDLLHIPQEDQSKAVEHNNALSNQGEPPAFVPADTESMWFGSQHHFEDPSKPIQPPDADDPFFTQTFPPLLSSGYASPSSYGWNNQWSGLHTSLPLDGYPSLAWSPDTSTFPAPQADFMSSSLHQSRKPFEVGTYRDVDICPSPLADINFHATSSVFKFDGFSSPWSDLPMELQNDASWNIPFDRQTPKRRRGGIKSSREIMQTEWMPSTHDNTACIRDPGAKLSCTHVPHAASSSNSVTADEFDGVDDLHRSHLLL